MAPFPFFSESGGGRAGEAPGTARCSREQDDGPTPHRVSKHIVQGQRALPVRDSKADSGEQD